MNSKILFLFVSLFAFGCGVKGPPKQYPDTAIDSYTASYTGGELTPEEKERMKNETIIHSTIDPKKNTAEPVQTTKP